MGSRKNLGLLIWIVLFAGVVGSSCRHDRSVGTPVESTASVGQPSEDVVGTVIGTVSQQPVAGVTVFINTRSVVTDATGHFRLDDVETGDVAVTISGDQIYPRKTYLSLPNHHDLFFDVIEKNSGFHLGFYRELARGNHPTEHNMFPIHRWTHDVAPTFYIDTNSSATFDDVITEETIAFTRDVISRMLSVFSGDVYKTATIQVQEFSRYSFDTLPSHSIAISFDDGLYARGGIGLTITEPDCLSMTANSIEKAWIFVVHREEFYLASGMSREEVLAHELGHSFGYRHTSLLPSIMNKIGGNQRRLSEHDRLHMAVMYARPVGNTDIDNDPENAATGKASAFQREIFFDPVADVEPLPPEMRLRLQSLSRLSDELLRAN